MVREVLETRFTVSLLIPLVQLLAFIWTVEMIYMYMY